MSILNSDIGDFIISFLVASLGFVFYLIIKDSLRVHERLRITENNTLQIIFQRITGVFFLGLLPVFFILGFSGHSFKDFGMVMPGADSWLWTGILGVIVVLINYFNASSKDNLKQYPQIRCSKWTLNTLLLSALSWTAYLLAYEFLFRGFFFFSSLRILGLWPAILVNTGIYSLVHIPKGSRETLGAIPLGVVLCYLTYKTGGIWMAFMVHLIMALSNEWFSIKAHPKITFVNSWK